MGQHLIRMPGFPNNNNIAATRAGTWSAPTSVASSATAVALIGANSNRIGLTIINNSPNPMYVRCAPVATPATTLVYDRLIPGNYTYEWPSNEVPTTALNAIGTGGATWLVSEALP